MTTITHQQRSDALRMLRAAGIGTSDCRLVRPEGEHYLELRSYSGQKRIAVVAMTPDGRVCGAWRG